MKKTILLVLMLSISQATTLQTLFEKLKSSPDTKGDIISILQGSVNEKLIKSNLMPKLNLSLSADHYTFNSPLRALTPRESKLLAKKPQPFGHNIYKESILLTMPLYLKSIYTMAKSAEFMQESQRAKKRINLLKNQALIVGANANLIYLEKLERALEHKRKTLLTIRNITQKAVNLGRFSESALFKIDDKLSEIDINKINIEISKEKIKESINSLTGVYLKHSVRVRKVGKIKKSSFAPLAPLKKASKAALYQLKATKEQKYPTVTMHAAYTLSQTNAYNTDSFTHENYGMVGVKVNIPLYNKELDENIELKKLKLLKSQIAIKKMAQNLKAQAKNIKKSLALLYKQRAFYKKSIQSKKRLLNIARVSYKNGVMTIEEFLRYQDDLISQEANLYQVNAKILQNQAQLAMLYGNNLERIFK